MSAKLMRCTASALKIRSLPDLSGATDTGARMIAGQVALSIGITHAGDWHWVQAPAGTGWVSAAYLEEAKAAPAVVIAPLWPRIPRGLAEIREVYGEPCSPRCSSGRVKLPAPLKNSWDGQMITTIACHEVIEPVFISLFAEIHRRGLWHLLEDYGGVYACREVRGSTKNPSTHSWGIGIDLNVAKFPLGSRKKQDARLLAIFDDHGFINGASWARPDPMHWQRVVGY